MTRYSGSSFLAVVLIALLACFSDVQAQDTTSRDRTRGGGGTLSGVVRDSLVQRPLVGAVVQIVGVGNREGFNRSTLSDSLGRFTLSDVPDGRYMLGFFHVMLDSLGLEPPLRQIVMERQAALRADLAIPSPNRLFATICGARQVSTARSDSGAVVIGFVRDARTRAPAVGANVIAEWLELSFTASGVVRNTPRLVATTGASGWFALCDVPRPGIVSLSAAGGTDSTDRLEVHIPTQGFLRRDLYLGSRDGSAGERLIGSVTTRDGGQPVRQAAVSLHGRPISRANENGEWTVTDAPLGTRMLEVRAIGFYPERLPVDVIRGAAPVRVALSTLRSVLDTVRVTVSRLSDRYASGFEDRRRTGLGHYLTAQDIARRQAIDLSDVFRAVPRMRVDRSPDGDVILMRGTLEDWCVPSVYVDGVYVGELSVGEMNSWMRPGEVRAIEVYSGAHVPAEFNRGMAGPVCGSIVIWSK